jgi:hypothetical protein
LRPSSWISAARDRSSETSRCTTEVARIVVELR